METLYSCSIPIFRPLLTRCLSDRRTSSLSGLCVTFHASCFTFMAWAQWCLVRITSQGHATSFKDDEERRIRSTKQKVALIKNIAHTFTRKL